MIIKDILLYLVCAKVLSTFFLIKDLIENRNQFLYKTIKKEKKTKCIIIPLIQMNVYICYQSKALSTQMHTQRMVNRTTVFNKVNKNANSKSFN